MAHSHEEKKEKSIDSLYYLVGIVCGLFTGWISDSGIIWTIIGGVMGLLTAVLFLQVFVRGREQR